MTRDYSALLLYFAERATMPFAWGSRANDCVSFAAGAVLAMTGKQLLEGISWTTERGARRVLKREGGLEAATTARRRPIALAHALRGDIAGVEIRGALALMIIEGTHLVGPGNRRLPRTAMIKAWSATDG